jgi:predicted CXXCH cytochrome family protein
MGSERVHDPAGEDCLECHRPHLSTEATLLSQPVQALCGECHESEDDSFKEAHLRIEAASMDCISCHAPHASKDRNFFKENMHSPFVKGNCDECHIVESQ